MITEEIQILLKSTGLSEESLVAYFKPNPQDLRNTLAILDAVIETAVIGEVDLFTQSNERDTILIRFISEDDFALYEPDLFEQFKLSAVHSAFIARTKRALERIGGKITIAYMESSFYETWLGINDFDDSRDLRITWARQQIRGLSN
jgi:hypothetical protein